ncbi:MAG TPA: PAAR-like domain-containing protein [Desulfobacterales bacterium]
MSSVGIHPPKTPVTKGSRSKAKATIPNVCKMPGPPAPFVPSPLPNIAKSEMSPKGYSKKVKIEGNAVAIRGASFKSMGDMASKGTGGGLISANTHGPAKFITPGSLTVKIENKSVHLLGEPILNNCGPSGNPPNTGATMMGVDHSDIDKPEPFVVNIDCAQKMKKPKPGSKKWDKCMCQQLCAKIKKMDDARKKGVIVPTPGARTTADYAAGKRRFIKDFMERVQSGKGIRSKFIHKCAADKYMEKLHPENPTTGGHDAPFNADHMHEAALGGDLLSMDNFKMLDKRVNQSISFESYDPDGLNKGKPIKAHPSCNCPHGPE